ncbi:MAG: sugar transferase [Rhodospirillaceae bacterium]|nr:sugar transferase [Rhodospirillaceae bacterium]
MIKRGFDLVFAAVGLLALTPVLLVTAIVIVLESPGPVFFRQVRVGRHGARFRIFKFRTMRGEEPTSGPILTIGDNPRITPIGRFLRRYKIDELPQLINVVMGDMSLVGPRPEVPRYVEKWTPEQKSVVLSVRPGITGPASVKFRNQTELLATYPNPEVAYETIVMQEKLKICADYVRHAGLWTDIKLIAQTLAALLRPNTP